MKYILIAFAILVIAYVGYEYVRTTRLARVGAKLVTEARPYIKAEGTQSMLVLGDSTAVGVGASAGEFTVAGRLADALYASVVNFAKSGAVTADLAGQLAHAERTHYDLMLIQIGANDIIHFNSVDTTTRELDDFLQTATEKSDHIVLLTGGRVGNAPFFPQLFGWLWTNHAARLRAGFMATAAKYGVAYVDLFATPDPMGADPARYYARDGLHLTNDGYGFWFSEVQPVLAQKL